MLLLTMLLLHLNWVSLRPCCNPLICVIPPTSGSVPAYYREVHQAVSGRADERVQVQVFQRLLSRTDLPGAVQAQVSSTALDSDQNDTSS